MSKELIDRLADFLRSVYCGYDQTPPAAVAELLAEYEHARSTPVAAEPVTPCRELDRDAAIWYFKRGEHVEYRNHPNYKGLPIDWTKVTKEDVFEFASAIGYQFRLCLPLYAAAPTKDAGKDQAIAELKELNRAAGRDIIKLQDMLDARESGPKGAEAAWMEIDSAQQPFRE